MTAISVVMGVYNAAANLAETLESILAQTERDFELLVMPPAEREVFLTNRPPEIRERILAKVAEYEVLDPDERELRLQATELRWYLAPLMREPATNRAARLAQVPDDVRDLVKDRLLQWEILPPPLQQEFLENERTLNYFEQVGLAGNAAILPDEKRRRIAMQFNQFFELTPDEKQKTLNTLSDAERTQMEKTLQSFDKLPPDQRRECVRAFTEFAGMGLQERAEFLKNAKHWSQMPPKERQAWRDLVAEVPTWPPLPQALLPPAPPQLNRAAVATNRN